MYLLILKTGRPNKCLIEVNLQLEIFLKSRVCIPIWIVSKTLATLVYSIASWLVRSEIDVCYIFILRFRYIFENI